jgi:hypothetical protein
MGSWLNTARNTRLCGLFVVRAKIFTLEEGTMPHKTVRKTVRLANGAEVDVMFWAEGTAVFVAGYDKSGRQVTAAVYSAAVDIADDFAGTFCQPLIDSLVNVVEYDLQNNPQLHYRPQHAQSANVKKVAP